MNENPLPPEPFDLSSAENDRVGTTEPAPFEDGMVQLRVPAHSAYVSLLRTVTAGLAARCDLTLDEIEDLRIAVDEASALLLPLAAPQSDLQARFLLSAGQLIVHASVATHDQREPSRDGFGWTVLDALTDQVQVLGADGHLTISLTKRRESEPR